MFGTYFNTDGDLVGDFGHTDENGETKVFTFKTAKTDGDFEFLAVSDPQGMIQSMYDQTANAFDVINGSSLTNGYDFIINAGDMVDAGKNFYQWQYALNTMIDTYANTSMFFAPGNHENGSFAIDKFFNFTRPDNAELNTYGEHMQDYYSFDYASGHFIVLDTNDSSGKGLGKKQLEWLEADLEATDKDFIFVIMHKSLFSTGAHANDVEVVAMREQLVPLFDEFGVDMVFGGHDHVYAETLPIGDSETIYVTLGTIGTKFYDYTNDNEDVELDLDYDKSMTHTLTDQTLGYVKVVDGVLYYNGYTVGQLQAIKAFESSAISSGTPKEQSQPFNN
jgi:3',5'-cyclic AMP phosphodiesterase CpdA